MRERLGRQPDFTRGMTGEHGGDAADVVLIRVRNDERPEPSHAERSECWDHPIPTRVEAREGGSGIHQPALVGPVQQNRVPVAHVE